MLISITSYEELIDKLQNGILKKDKIVVNYYTLHNMGIELLNKVTTNFAVKNNIIIDCGKSLSYLLYALEKGFNIIISTSEHKDILQSIKKEYKILLFTSYEELANHFNKNN